MKIVNIELEILIPHFEEIKYLISTDKWIDMFYEYTNNDVDSIDFVEWDFNGHIEAGKFRIIVNVCEFKPMSSSCKRMLEKIHFQTMDVCEQIFKRSQSEKPDFSDFKL